MLQRGLFVSALLLAILPGAALAQKVEITPFAGFRFGGDFDDPTSFAGPVELELDDGPSSGVILGVGITRRLQVELTWSRQETELLESGGLFGTEQELFDLDVESYHAGVAYQWPLGQVRPFVAGSLGATRLDPDDPGFESETRFSLSFGGGVKLMFAKNLGVRFEGRLIAIDLDDDDDYCGRRYCEDDDLTQGELRAGLVIAF